MAFISLIPIDLATGRIKSIYEAALERAGYVANIIRVMSQDARSCEASMGLYGAIMKSENGLTGAQREMLATVVSNVNDCFY